MPSLFIAGHWAKRPFPGQGEGQWVPSTFSTNLLSAWYVPGPAWVLGTQFHEQPPAMGETGYLQVNKVEFGEC